MNRLRYHFVYLAGPITNADDAGATWRKGITPALNAMGVIVLDPCSKPIDTEQMGFRDESKEDVLAIDAMLHSGQPDERKKALGILKEIRHFDLRMIDRADFVIAFLDRTIPTTGTMEEIFTANRAKKPVLVVNKQGALKVPMWLNATLPDESFFSTWDDLFAYLRGIDSGAIREDLSRWVFFNLDGQINSIHAALSAVRYEDAMAEFAARSPFPAEYDG